MSVRPLPSLTSFDLSVSHSGHRVEGRILEIRHSRSKQTMRLLPLVLLLNLPLLSARQIPPMHSEGEVRVDNSPFIFTALNGLLRQWPNVYAPVGFSVVPGIIPASTLLYHARQDGGAPPNPEWLAFDAFVYPPSSTSLLG